MPEIFWKCVALVLCRPAVSAWLVNYSQRTPYTHIGKYMSRFWLVKRRAWLPFCARIHHIKLADADHALHDHPAGYRTFILNGSYVEEDVFGRHRIRRTGDTASGVAERFHRIDSVSPGGVWTLFILGRNQKDDWGFMVSRPNGDPRKVPWFEYVSPNDRGELQ